MKGHTMMTPQSLNKLSYKILKAYTHLQVAQAVEGYQLRDPNILAINLTIKPKRTCMVLLKNPIQPS